MKNRIFILLGFLFIGIFAKSQGTLSLLKNMEENHFLENETMQGRHIFMLGGSAMASISEAKMNLLKPFVFGGIITDEIKNENLGLFNQSNQAGFSMNSEIITAHRTDEIFGKNTMLFIGIGYRSMSELNFSDAHARLILEGNKSSINNPIDLKALQFESIDYAGVRLGFAKYLKQSDNIHHYYGFSLGFLQSVSHFKTAVHTGTFSTQPNSYDLDLNTQYLLQRSDTSGLSLFKGQGFNASFFYGTKIKNRFGFSIGIEELGILSWKNGLSSEKNVHHQFSGIAIQDITQTDNVQSLQCLTDSIRNSLVYPERVKNYNTLLPMSVVGSFSYRYNKHVGAESFVRFFPISVRNLEAMFQINTYLFNQSLRVSPFVYSSGYRTVSPGIEVAYINGKNIYVKAGSYSLNFSQATLGGFAAIGYKL
jgi:hypothetical protein